jgi:alpha-D-xyloside xylohydrolase
MLPYIYSLAWKVTDQDYTMMRPLVMDWRNDREVWDIGDEFMFGPGLLVAPVTKAHASSRPVYLPHASAWYDFWTGKRVVEGQLESIAPLDRIPVYVPAGTVLRRG